MKVRARADSLESKITEENEKENEQIVKLELGYESDTETLLQDLLE